MLTLGTLGLVAAHLLSWGAVCHALLHKRDPRSALGWIVTVLFLPGVGIVLYCLFGISRAESLAARLMRKMAAIEPDYAHHPAEIAQSVKSIRELYRDKKITAIFQPHLYTRTRDFYKDFADSLSLLDEVILTEIYPAREQPIPGVSSQLIYDNLRPGIEKCICRKEDIPDLLSKKPVEVLIVLGAGDLDNYVPSIARLLEQRSKA